MTQKAWFFIWVALRFSPCGLRCSRSLRFARVESRPPCPGVARMGEDGSAIFLPKKWRTKPQGFSSRGDSRSSLKTAGFLHIFTKFQKPCLWSRSLWSLVKRSACAAREVAACRRVDVFLFTALRLHDGKPPWIFFLQCYIKWDHLMAESRWLILSFSMRR